MELLFAVAKVSKYASRESGDTLEMTERPHGGLSMVLVDGQRSGRSAKVVSNVVARKAVQLLAEGVRDGAAARAAHDYLFTYRGGKVSATLNILSVDMRSGTLVISRNNPAPVVVHTAEKGVYLLDEPSSVVGVHRQVKPIITEIPVAVGTVIVIYTDGLQHAGSFSGSIGLNPADIVADLIDDDTWDANEIANTLLDRALELEKGRPKDDISIMCMSVIAKQSDDTRRLSGRLPL